MGSIKLPHNTQKGVVNKLNFRVPILNWLIMDLLKLITEKCPKLSHNPMRRPLPCLQEMWDPSLDSQLPNYLDSHQY